MRIKIVMLILVLLAGCSDQKIIEDLGFVRTIAFDLIEGVNPKDQVEITYSIPMAQVKDKLLFTTVAKTSKQARVIFSRQNDRSIVSGQLRQVLLSKDLARQGIWNHIDALLRDPSIGRNVYVVLVDGSAKDLLEKPYKQDPSSGEYIHDMLERGMILTDIPRSNLHTFSRDYYDRFTDPAVPVLKLENKFARLSGIAFLRDDRYVTEIDQKNNIMFTSLRKNLHTGELSINITEQTDGKQDSIILGYIESKRKIKVKIEGSPTNGDNIQVHIDVKMAGSLLDYTGDLDLSIPKNQEKLEKIMAKYIKKEADKIIKQTQKYKVDPIGIGQYVRNRIPYKIAKDLDWHEVYPHIKVTLGFDVKIKEYGKMQ